MADRRRRHVAGSWSSLCQLVPRSPVHKLEKLAASTLNDWDWHWRDDLTLSSSFDAVRTCATPRCLLSPEEPLPGIISPEQTTADKLPRDKIPSNLEELSFRQKKIRPE